MQILVNCGKFSFLPLLQHLCCLSYSVWLWFERKTLGSPRDLCMQNSQSHQPYRRGPTKCNHSETVTRNATSASERFPSPLCPSCSWNHVCVKSLPSEVLTYLLLSSAHIFSWPRTSSRPSGWPWHTHRTSSLSFLLKETAVQRDSAASQTFYMQSSKKNLYFAFYNSAVHFTLDPSWCLLHICGIWDCSVKAAFLEGISDAWVAVALTSPAIMFHTPWWRKRKGIWISNMDSPWNTLWVQQKVLHWPFLQPPHSPKFLLLLSECYMSVGICAMCNTTIHKQLFSLAEFHTHPVHCLSPLKVVCRTCNYGPIIHKYDIVRFLGSKMSKIKRLYFFI